MEVMQLQKEIAELIEMIDCLKVSAKALKELSQLYESQSNFKSEGLNFRRKVGLISMGQSNREDMKEDIEDIIQPKFDIVGVGILDGYSLEEIKDKFWPKEEENFIVSIIENNQMVKISESNAYNLINKKIHALEEDNILCNMLMCTGQFPEFNNKGILLRPEKILCSILKAMDIKKLGIIVPEEEQIEDSLKQYHEFKPEIIAASPYGPMENIKKASTKFNKDIDLVLLDCMGFTEKMKKIVEDETGLNVMLPRTLIAGILHNIA